MGRFSFGGPEECLHLSAPAAPPRVPSELAMPAHVIDLNGFVRCPAETFLLLIRHLPLVPRAPRRYMDWVGWAVGQGFSAVKFHCWNVFEKDLVLARAARERFPDLTFMLDVENNYSYTEAEAMAQELTALGGWAWFEAPLHDSE
jgi:hypothetical protein